MINTNNDNAMTAEKLVELSRMIGVSPLPDEKKDQFVTYLANASEADLLKLYELVLEANKSEDKLNEVAKNLSEKVVDVELLIDDRHQAEANKLIDYYMDEDNPLPE